MRTPGKAGLQNTANDLWRLGFGLSDGFKSMVPTSGLCLFMLLLVSSITRAKGDVRPKWEAERLAFVQIWVASSMNSNKSVPFEFTHMVASDHSAFIGCVKIGGPKNDMVLVVILNQPRKWATSCEKHRPMQPTHALSNRIAELSSVSTSNPCGRGASICGGA